MPSTRELASTIALQHDPRETIRVQTGIDIASADANVFTIDEDLQVAQQPVNVDCLPSISVSFSDGSPGESSSGSRALADFSIIRILGEGGMAVVYLANQNALRREVAVKVPRKLGPAAVAGMLNEARCAGSLEHPNIVPVHALGSDSHGSPILVMKRIEGAPWRALVNEPKHPAWSCGEFAGEEPLTVHLRILMQVASALHFAHSKGIAHRDVKLDNVMIGLFGEVYLTDWGLARRMASTVDPGLVGTPGYMAPEMVSRSSVDARTDVYLLGSTLHEILTGQLRHPAPTTRAALAAASLSEPFQYPPSVPTELANLCNAATSREKANRPPTAAAFRQALAAFLQHRGSIALAASAERSLADLKEILQRETATSSVVAARMAECRFGFLEALREWEGNERARQGLDVTLAYMVERELSQRNPSAARALLAEMRSPNSELLERLRQLEADIAAQRESQNRLADLLHDRDANVAVLPRAIAVGVLLLLAVASVLSSLVQELRTRTPMPMTDMLTCDFVMCVAMTLILSVWRRVLLSNVYNRHVWLMFFCLVVGGTVIDSVSWLRGLPSSTSSLFNAILFAQIFMMGGVMLHRVFLWMALMCGVTVVIALVFPLLANASVAIDMILAACLYVGIAGSPNLPGAKDGQDKPGRTSTR
jgi:serine/threonine-protein kinase